jgi:hypothetical protein
MYETSLPMYAGKSKPVATTPFSFLFAAAHTK